MTGPRPRRIQRDVPLASILLAIVAFACTGIGVVTTPIRGVGELFSFGAPVLALTGCVLGGVAMSRAKRTGAPTDMARAGVILSVIAFLPAVLVALVCGTCNALFTHGDVHVQKDLRFGVNQGLPPTGGAGDEPAPQPTMPGQTPTGAAGSTTAPAQDPALPPPPLPAGPRRNPASPGP